MNASKQQKKAKKIQGSVLRQLSLLSKMPTPQLREKWTELNGIEPLGYNRQQLLRRLAYRIQEMYYGGLVPKANKHLVELAQKDALACASKKPVTKSNGTHLVSGTRFRRRWRGVEYEVTVVEGGFEYKEQVYRSLTAVARAITGMKRSGRDFFGLPPLRKMKKKGRKVQ